MEVNKINRIMTRHIETYDNFISEMAFTPRRLADREAKAKEMMARTLNNFKHMTLKEICVFFTGGEDNNDNNYYWLNYLNHIGHFSVDGRNITNVHEKDYNDITAFVNKNQNEKPKELKISPEQRHTGDIVTLEFKIENKKIIIGGHL